MTLVLDKLLEPIKDDMDSIEYDRHKHGNETFRWVDFVKILVVFFTKRIDSLNALATELEDNGTELGLPAVPKMTLSDGFHRFSPLFLRRLLKVALAKIDWIENPELLLLGQVSVVDGSVFPVIGGIKWPLPGEVADVVKLHLQFELNRMLPVDFLLGRRYSSERAALKDMLQAEVTYVLDRGYMSFSLLKDIIQAKAYVVMRVYNNVVVTSVEEREVVLPKPLQGVWGGVRDRLVRSEQGEAAGLVFRLVEFSVGDTEYKLISNRMDITTFQVILLYAYRWQIELIFRHFKHTMVGMKVISVYSVGIENYFLGMLLTAVLHLYLKEECLLADGYEPPTQEDIEAEWESAEDEESTQVSPVSSVLAVARFLTTINDGLALFWKISKHWLITLGNYLHRPFNKEVVHILNKRALVAHNFI